MSYSQSGEDMIVRAIFERMTLKKPSYLDLGANDPTFLSNTMSFYLSGSSGVLVEPDSGLAAKLKRLRKRDLIVNAGVGWGQGTTSTFFKFDANVLSTFDKEAARVFMERGHILVEKTDIGLVHINEILETYFPNGLDSLSIDIEGGEFEVLSAMDLKKYRPHVMIVETWESPKGKWRPEINDLLERFGYEAYVTLKPNVIFVTAEVLDLLI